MEGANKAMNGNWMHDNPDGKKDKLIIPDKFVPFNTNGKDVGVPFLSSVATVPRNAAMGAYNLATGNFKEAGKNVASFASMPLKTAGEVLTNENYFGQRIVDEDATGAQKLGQMAAYVGRSNTQPWLREGINVAGQSLPDDIKKLMGVKKKSTSETISNALEAPVRFYDPQYYTGGKGDMMAGSKFKGSGVKIGDKTEKNAAGKYTSRSKYDAVIDAYYKKDGSIKVNNYDNAELSKTIRDVAGEANKTLADMGLPEVKADSRTAQIWAKYQKRLQDGKISEIKKDYVQRGVIKDIYKTQLSKDVNDFYTISSDTAMRSAIEKGLVKKETLDKAIQFDDMMVASGLSPYSQIGKKLRSELGYSSPSSSKSTGGRRSSGRKSAGRKGSRGGKKAAKFDYTKNLFDTGRGGSKATTASLRKILEQAMSDFKTKA
jgi:hypothetical protein